MVGPLAAVEAKSIVAALLVEYSFEHSCARPLRLPTLLALSPMVLLHSASTASRLHLAFLCLVYYFDDSEVYASAIQT